MMLGRIIFVFLLVLSAQVHAHPCTFTFSKYPELCVHIERGGAFYSKNQISGKTEIRSLKKDVQTPGGKVYFYIWNPSKGNKPINISEGYEVAPALVMPFMFSGLCVTGKFNPIEWQENADGAFLVGTTNVMSGVNRDSGEVEDGLYRVWIKVKKKGDQSYSELKRKIPVPNNDPMFNYPNEIEFNLTTEFTHQFIVPAAR